MPKFLIEREIPGAGKMSAEQLRAAAQKSCAALSRIGPQVQWVQSYVTGDKIYCVYISPDEQAVREHERLSGIPATKVSRITQVIDPVTAE